MQKYVKQFGLQRSGTTIVKGLLEENCDGRVLSNFPLSRHMRLVRLLEIRPAAACDLAALGMDRAPYDAFAAEFAQQHVFIVRSIRPLGSWAEASCCFRLSLPGADGLKFDCDVLVGALARWKDFTMSCLNYAQADPALTQIVRHEDLLRGSADWLQTIAARAGLQPRGALISAFDGYAGRGNDRYRGRQVIDLHRLFERIIQLGRVWAGRISPWATRLIDAWAVDLTANLPEVAPYV